MKKIGINFVDNNDSVRDEYICIELTKYRNGPKDNANT